MDAPEHDRYRELTAMYALETLSPDERAACVAHLATCPACTAEVRAFRGVTDALAHTPVQTPPSSSLRARVLSAVTERAAPTASPFSVAIRPRISGAWLAVAASLALTTMSGGYALQLRGRLAELDVLPVLNERLREALLRAEASEREVAELRRVTTEAQGQIVVLAAPDVARVDLIGQSAAPSAMARAFWSRSRGLVFTATDLPALPAGRTYQLWVVTARAPISAGLVRPDATGRASMIFETPPDIPPPVAMALTLEPEGGVPAPTGARYLVGTPAL